MPRFKPGDRIVRTINKHGNSPNIIIVPFKITSIRLNKYIVSNSNGVKNLHLGFTETVDKQFILFEVWNSPLYKVMNE